jgi:hypothetical protein
LQKNLTRGRVRTVRRQHCARRARAEVGYHDLPSAGSLEELAALLERDLRFPAAIVADLQLADGRTGLDAIAAVQGYSGEPTPAVIVTGEDLGKSELESEGRLYPVVKKPLAAEALRRRLTAVLT